jgi:hypothetical protein
MLSFLLEALLRTVALKKFLIELSVLSAAKVIKGSQEPRGVRKGCQQLGSRAMSVRNSCQ